MSKIITTDAINKKAKEWVKEYKGFGMTFKEAQITLENAARKKGYIIVEKVKPKRLTPKMKRLSPKMPRLSKRMTRITPKMPKLR